jgi:hypothetical protein
MNWIALLLMSLVPPSLAAVPSGSIHGRVVDAVTHQPLPQAILTSSDGVVVTDAAGQFVLPSATGEVGVRAYGHARIFLSSTQLVSAGGEIALLPLLPKALYLSSLGIADRALRTAALRIAESTEINALVIDLKSDRGLIAFPAEIPLADAVGATHRTVIADLPALVRSLRQQSLYCIARIVVFKDDTLARARPDLAVKTSGGQLWRDRDGIAWTNPDDHAVWEYNIALAEQAARAGFDEIQFDYVRFPDDKGLALPGASTQAQRIAAISGFLELARRRLMPYNVFIAADIYGYVCWNFDDTGVGQTLATMLPYVDYLSPMLYPSCFQFGIPGERNPVEHPYEIVFETLERAIERTRVPAVRFRPWLQAFRDYAFDHRAFRGTEIRDQISAAERAGTDGWMLWNPRNLYSSDGLERKP